MPIKYRKDKRSFNQGKIQQISKVDTKKNCEKGYVKAIKKKRKKKKIAYT